MDPPKVAVAPIAPFVSDQELADDIFADLGDEISPFGRIADERFDAGTDASGIQFDLLGFVREARVEIGDRFNIPQSSFSYEGIDEVRILFCLAKSTLMELRR